MPEGILVPVDSPFPPTLSYLFLTSCMFFSPYFQIPSPEALQATRPIAELLETLRTFSMISNEDLKFAQKVAEANVVPSLLTLVGHQHPQVRV